jgi:Na+-transporting methylmalonyl-CoA/oxaloacetate decarboxylase gamma subunit
MEANLIAALNIMWMGMAGLFIVMILIALIVVALGKTGNNKTKQ